MTRRYIPTSATHEVVVAVVSWNTRELLDRCLRSLRPAADAGLAEVWVVDNASTDGSAAMVRDVHPWVRLVASTENLGYGRAANLVAERTSSPWLAVANADVAVRGDALEQLIAAGEGDPRAGIVVPRLILPDGSTQHSVWPLPEPLPMAMANLGPRLVPDRVGERLVLWQQWDPERPRRVPWALGAFLLVRRSAWDEVRGFDPHQWMSAEDLDLGWRMREAGWATRYEPAAVVDHDESAAAGQRWGAHLQVHWQRCAYAWMVRRLGRRRAAVIGAINFAGSAARLLALGLLSLWRPARFRPRLPPQAAWTKVHAYALAPRRTLDRYR
jgi:N-acetylglucosaminyl-diphospho-decaprenol L-rhamnosyltransferase